MRGEAVGGKREREDPTSKGLVECRIISGLHTFHVSAHYTHEARCSPSLSSSPSAKMLARPKAYSSLPEKIPEGHKRRTVGPEVERTEQRPRRRRDRRRRTVSSVTDIYRES